MSPALDGLRSSPSLAAPGGRRRRVRQQRQQQHRWRRLRRTPQAKSPVPASTAQEAAQEAWIAEFENANSGATISYDPVGSGGGREQFIAGGVAFAGSDAPLSEEEGELKKAMKRCDPGELIEVPAYVSPIAIIYNLEASNRCSSPRTLAKIFNQEITTWNDPAIANDNPGVELPDTRITPVNRSDESGTTENFTEYLSEVAPKRLDARSERRLAGQGRRGRRRHLRRRRSGRRRRRRDRLRRREPGRRTRHRQDRGRRDYAEPTPEAAAASPRGVAGRQGHAKTASTCSRSNSTARPNRRAPTRSSWSPT